MATNWYYRRGGRDHGPFTPKQFKSLAAAGIVQPTDMIRRDGMPEGKWLVGSKVDGLFPEEPVAAPDRVPEAIESQTVDVAADSADDGPPAAPRSKAPLAVAVVVLLAALAAAAAWWLM